MLPIGEWWQWLLLLVVVVAVTGLSVAIYRRDSAALPKPLAVALLSLRLMALLGLLLFFLGPEKRSEARLVKPSRLAVLIDTSLSMGLNDSDSVDGSQQVRRIDRVIDLANDAGLLTDLNQQHELKLYRFSETNKPELIAEAEKQQPISIARDEGAADATDAASAITGMSTSRSFGFVGQVSILIAILCLLASIVLRMKLHRFGPSTMAGGSLLLALGVLILAIADLLVSNLPLPVSLGWQDAVAAQNENAVTEFESTSTLETTNSGDSQSASDLDDLDSIDWNEQLAPRGIATRLGAAVEHVVSSSRGTALAGILLITDGCQNQGTSASRAIAMASDANIPVYVIGIGSEQPARNIRVSEIEAPGRVFPNDKFKVNGIVQSYGFQDESVRVRLSSTNEDQSDGPVEVEDERSIRLPADGEPINVNFELARQEEGRRRYFIEIDAPAGDLDATDNSQSTVVQVLQQRTKVLLVAGGPSRDYQFLRNQLFRDENVQLDVWLQNARPGADQESDQLLFQFPETAEQLNEYDCLVGFDPDWRLMSKEQMRNLDRWVSEKAGGMLLIAGPVFTPEWTRRPRGEETIDLIRGLYPVSFYSQGSAALKLGRFGGKQAFPLAFSREGRTAKHLWLGKSGAAESISNWESFRGVYGYYAVNEPKAGAEILARFSDPSTEIEGELPIYLASQYYGAGRVFFQASGEIWRLRTADVQYFQSYYLNIIRWVSEGRLLRDSNRGVLLPDRNRCWVGDQVTVRAILRDAADQPLMQKSVQATVRNPDGSSQTIQLTNIQDVARPGSFTGQLVTTNEGNHEIVLPLPFDAEGQPLKASIHAAIPDLEKVNPERNDSLLSEIAARTGGIYFFDVDGNGQAKTIANTDDPDFSTAQSVSLSGSQGLSGRIGVVDQETFLPGSPDEWFARKFSRWLVFWLALVLCTEWIVRRLHKLA